jgi:transaldolase
MEVESMTTPLQSLVACGTKLWLDSVDPDEVKRNRAWGATGATSNPIIVADLIKTGRFDEPMTRFLQEGLSDNDLAWRLTDLLVSEAQQVFLPVWQETRGDNGYVSFELDPLLEDPDSDMPVEERTRRYIALGKQWSGNQRNRMIKVPATPAGLGALEELAAAGVTLNVTLIFSPRQYTIARDAIWRGAGAPLPGGLQVGLQHLCEPAGRLHGEARPGTVAGGPGAGGHRQRQAHLAHEPGVLGRQAPGAEAGDDLRQHRDQEAE